MMPYVYITMSCSNIAEAAIAADLITTGVPGGKSRLFKTRNSNLYLSTARSG
jgi:hypothetical protein